MSSYLSVDIGQLQALAGDLATLLRALEQAVVAGKGATKTGSWKGPAAERYRSEIDRHRASLDKAVDEVRDGLAAVKSDITLAHEAKAAEQQRLQAEQERLQRLRAQEADA